jgi:hypothetical protein
MLMSPGKRPNGTLEIHDRPIDDQLDFSGKDQKPLHRYINLC